MSCLSCHRSHASAFAHRTRLGLASEFITLGDSAGNALYPDPMVNPALAEGRTVGETAAAYYDRPATRFAPFQRVLCNKATRRTSVPLGLLAGRGSGPGVPVRGRAGRALVSCASPEGHA